MAISEAQLKQRREAPLKHGAKSGTALVPLSRNIKQSVLKRMGMRQIELSWAGRETLDLYARNKAKLIGMDRYFETHPLIGEDGEPAGATRIYWLSFNAALRSLDSLRAVIAQMTREDDRYDSALRALADEGRKVRERERERAE
jgi:hypothetical protein